MATSKKVDGKAKMEMLELREKGLSVCVYVLFHMCGFGIHRL